jgi:hypothetical protein
MLLFEIAMIQPNIGFVPPQGDPPIESTFFWMFPAIRGKVFSRWDTLVAGFRPHPTANGGIIQCISQSIPANS